LEIGCPVTAVCWSADGNNIYVGAIDNEIHVGAYYPWLFLLHQVLTCPLIPSCFLIIDRSMT
jgi:hypothetical protein